MQKFFTPRTLLVCFIAMLTTKSMGQSIPIANGSTYSQNFNSMPITNLAPLPAGFRASTPGAALTVSGYTTSFQTATNVTAGENMSPSNPPAGIYNFGEGINNLASSDRAVGGFVVSGGIKSVNIFMDLVNTGATPITSFNFVYTIEKYRNGTSNGGKKYGVTLHYSLTGADGSWLPLSTTIGSPFNTAFAPDANSNGFSPAPDANQTVHVNSIYTLPTGTTITNGNHIYFAWCISHAYGEPGNGIQNGQALGIDDIRITGGGVGAILPGKYFRSIASGNWNTITPGSSTWESSVDNGVSGWTTPDHIPGIDDFTITVRNGHTVTVSTPVTTDETTIDLGGTLNVTSTGIFSINDGVGYDLTINGTLNNNTGGKFIILSNDDVKQGDIGTASIGRSTPQSVTGNATVQRFISAYYGKSAWRLLTAPLAATGTNTTIFDAWQNGGSLLLPGTGTRVTGPVNNGGLDAITTLPSMKKFNMATQLLDPVTQTNSASVNPLFTTAASAANNAFFIYVDGDRNAAPQASQSTTLTPIGKLQFGNQTFTTSSVANGLSMVGNPYACAVDLNAFRLDNTVALSNLNSTYYYWDPYLTGSVGYGGYVTVSYDGSGNLTITPADANRTAFLQSGQAMFVQTNSAGASSAKFTELQKIATTANYVFSPVANQEKIEINLKVINNGSAPIMADGITAAFNEDYSANVDQYDAIKLSNGNENISFMRDGKTLSIERRPTITSEDVLYINLAGLKTVRSYQFEIKPSLNTTAGLTAYINDNYLKTTTPLDLNSNTTVGFTITADAASTGSNRFSISFSKPAAIVAQPGNPTISVYPNPVANGTINLKLNNMPVGNYAVRVYNSLGQTMATKVINHAAGSSTETIQAKGLISGIYQLEVIKPDNSKFISKLLAK